ncbi:MAG: uroporphyrinogen decarboxylase family protein [Planctomycetota bacterium]|jgi:uroporphyrinogen decarboxylase
MTGREIVLKAIRGGETPRPAWVPRVGSHGAALIGEDADVYLNSSDLVFEGLCKAIELYNPDGLPVMFDLQIEAEALGCQLRWAKDGPAAVASYPLVKRDWTAEEMPTFNMNAGRIPLCMNVAKRMRAKVGSEIALYGVICGPFTLALHMLGNEIFIDLYDKQEEMTKLLKRCAEVGQQMAKGYLNAGCDVIAVVDPMVSQISPEHFDQFVAPAMNELYDYIRNKGGLSCCFACGDAAPILPNLSQTTCDSISLDELIDKSRRGLIASWKRSSSGGTLDLTTALLTGTETDAKWNAIETLESGKKTGFILSPGYDLPFYVKPENVAAAGLMVLDEVQRERTKSGQEEEPAQPTIIPLRQRIKSALSRKLAVLL